MRTSIVILLLAVFSILPELATAQLRLSRLIDDGVVVQRGTEVPVRGWASPGDEILVEFLGTPYETVADGNGAWSVSLPAMDAGGPYDLSVRGLSEVLRVRDIMVGDVWLASGQSNMEWVISDSDGVPGEDPLIRQFKIPRSWSYDEQDMLTGGVWAPADGDHVNDFTAVGYYFAQALREHIDVPIGIINSSWGGSRIEPWMSLDVLGLSRAAIDEIRLKAQAREDAIRQNLESRIGSLPDEDPGSWTAERSGQFQTWMIRRGSTYPCRACGKEAGSTEWMASRGTGRDSS